MRLFEIMEQQENPVLYHGSEEPLDSFEEDYSATNHIYTSTDPHTAKYYGDYVYVVRPNIRNLADLRPEEGDDELVHRLAKKFKDEIRPNVEPSMFSLEEYLASAENANNPEGWLVDDGLTPDTIEEIFEWGDNPDSVNERELIGKIQEEQAVRWFYSGRTYEHRMGRTIDKILQYLFDHGHNVVRMADESHYGTWDSWVFDGPNGLEIVKRWEG